MKYIKRNKSVKVCDSTIIEWGVPKCKQTSIVKNELVEKARKIIKELGCEIFSETRSYIIND